MPNDITTLAIEIQSQEAERNLKTFYEMLTLSSQTAGKMEKISIDLDAGKAIEQLRVERNGPHEAPAGFEVAGHASIRTARTAAPDSRIVQLRKELSF